MKTALNAAQLIMVNGGIEFSSLNKETLARVTHRVDVLKNAEGDGIVGFDIVGKNSDEFLANKNEVRIENIMRAAKRGSGIDTKTEEGATTVSNTVDANDHSKAVAVTVGWYGVNEEGQPATFNKERVSQLLASFPHWQDLILDALEKDENFMKV